MSTHCPDLTACRTPDLCKGYGRCERIVCWDCPYGESCRTDPDPMIRSCYGDPYNMDVEPGIDCLASK
jgi:hypothetical protein